MRKSQISSRKIKNSQMLAVGGTRIMFQANKIKMFNSNSHHNSMVSINRHSTSNMLREVATKVVEEEIVEVMVAETRISVLVEVAILKVHINRREL
jgi:hypothetical protein